jgi:hypothetical protein
MKKDNTKAMQILATNKSRTNPLVFSHLFKKIIVLRKRCDCHEWPCRLAEEEGPAQRQPQLVNQMS